jgi:hypothetical protein
MKIALTSLLHWHPFSGRKKLEIAECHNPCWRRSIHGSESGHGSLLLASIYVCNSTVTVPRMVGDAEGVAVVNYVTVLAIELEDD